MVMIALAIFMLLVEAIVMAIVMLLMIAIQFFCGGDAYAYALDR